jgi:hypothetical protein
LNAKSLLSFAVIYEVWNFDDAEFIYQTLENTPVGALFGGLACAVWWCVGEYGEREGFFLWFGSLKHCVATP